MVKKSGRKGRRRSNSKEPQPKKQQHPNNTIAEDIAEEMINGIFCHYEPPDESQRHKGILRKPRSRKAHSDESLAGSSQRRVRWSDLPEDDGKHIDDEPNTFGLTCGNVTCINDPAVRSGVTHAAQDNAMDYDILQSFSEDSNGIIRRRESQAHHDVIFDDQGNPVPTKPGARVDAPPPRPAPKKKESFIPELCGVKIGTEDDEHTYTESEVEVTMTEPTATAAKKENKQGYQPPDHKSYRPSWEYAEDEENSLIDEGKARKEAAAKQQTMSTMPVIAEGGQSVIPPPPPPPPPPPKFLSETNTSEAQPHPAFDASFKKSNMTHLNDTYVEDDWDGPERPRSDCSNLFGPAVVDDWDNSLSVIPKTVKKRFKGNKHVDPPTLDAPDSRDSQEENKPQKMLRQSPAASELGTEITWNDEQSGSRRLPFFRRGRGRDKTRQSLPNGRVEVMEEDKMSQVSGASKGSFLGFRSRSKSPNRRRIFGRTRSSSDVFENVNDDVEKQSYIGAYRETMSLVDAQPAFAFPGFHPSHPLNQVGTRKMSRDEAMERQSFITAHRNSMDGDTKVQSITERLRRLRMQRESSNGSGPVDLDESIDDDESFERSSLITAHREAFEGPSDRVATKPEQSTEKDTEENKNSWEKRTRDALERIRCGTDASTQALERIRCDNVAAENKEEAKSDENKEDGTSKEVGNGKDKKRQEDTKTKEAAKTEEEDSDKAAPSATTVPSTTDSLTKMFACTPSEVVKSPTAVPLKSILKSPGSSRRVTFGQDQERIFHDDNNENEPVLAPQSQPENEPEPLKKRASFLGGILGQRNSKKASQSPKKATALSPKSPSPKQNRGAPSPLTAHRASPVPQQSPMQAQLPYMYPPYPQYPPMMTSPNQMLSPSYTSDSSVSAPPPPPFYHPMQQQMCGMPSMSSDSSQQQQPPSMPMPPYMAMPSMSTDSSQQQQMPMPPYMAPYYYGYPYMYPPPVLPPNGSEDEKKKKKKKRVFRGKKLLNGVVSKVGRQSIGALGENGTLSSSFSGDGNADAESVDPSVYSTAQTKA